MTLRKPSPITACSFLSLLVSVSHMQPYLGDDHLTGYLTMPTPSPTTACHMQPYLGDDHLTGYLTMPTPSPTTACHMQPYLGDDHLTGYLTMPTLLLPLPVICSPIWLTIWQVT